MQNTLKSVQMDLSAFTMIRLEKDELYRMVEQRFTDDFSLNVEIHDMKIIPKKILDKEYVSWLFKPIRYTVKGAQNAS